MDTSGRLSNNVALNEELKKLKRTIADRIPGGPHETLLVLDGAVGRNGVDQVKRGGLFTDLGKKLVCLKSARHDMT